MIMLKLLKQRLKTNTLHIIIGCAIALIGLELWLNKGYFFWPPNASSVLNDDVVGFFGTALGCGIVLWSFSRDQNPKTNQIFLTLATAFMTLLAFVELGHALFMHYPRIFTNVITDVALIAVIMYIARHSDTK